MIDVGYNYERLQEKMQWLDISPANIKHILIIHQDTEQNAREKILEKATEL